MKISQQKRPLTFAMNSEAERPHKKKKKTNSSPSFLSLPDDIMVNCLARISRSYYPKISLVCKTFRSILLSKYLRIARFELNTIEKFFNVCLQFRDNPSPSWFTLWIKPDQILTNEIAKKKKKRSTGNNTSLVRIPSLYNHCVPPRLIGRIGSEYYVIKQHKATCNLWVCNKKNQRKALSMNVARESPAACVLGEKLYVLGGCKEEESKYWGEVFDTKTQTWEPLLDPGPEIRASLIRKIEVKDRWLYIISNDKSKDYVYDTKEGKWSFTMKILATCQIENVWYGCDKRSFFWYDTKCQEWRLVKGLSELNRNPRCGMIEIAKYKGKLLILWDKFVHRRGPRDNKEIWCVVIALERRNINGEEEVWGKIEWSNVVLKVPKSYVFVRSLVNVV